MREFLKEAFDKAKENPGETVLCVAALMGGSAILILPIAMFTISVIKIVVCGCPQ